MISVNRRNSYTIRLQHNKITSRSIERYFLCKVKSATFYESSIYAHQKSGEKCSWGCRVRRRIRQPFRSHVQCKQGRVRKFKPMSENEFQRRDKGISRPWNIRSQVEGTYNRSRCRRKISIFPYRDIYSRRERRKLLDTAAPACTPGI